MIFCLFYFFVLWCCWSVHLAFALFVRYCFAGGIFFCYLWSCVGLYWYFLFWSSCLCMVMYLTNLFIACVILLSVLCLCRLCES